MTNPQKKKKKQEILEVWTELKTKLITTLTELKANHKDKWAVVKVKSASERVKILPVHQLEKMQGELTEKKSLLQAMDQRKRNALLSPQDQVKYDQLTQEITNLQKELDWQESFRKLGWKQSVWDKLNLQYIQQALEEERKSKFTLQQELNEKYDRLNDKLNWLRTLVRAGDINQLQDLVRQAKI